MQTAIAFMAVVAGLLLSMVVAFLAEELIFGQLMRWFFVRQTPPVEKSGSSRNLRPES